MTLKKIGAPEVLKLQLELREAAIALANRGIAWLETIRPEGMTAAQWEATQQYRVMIAAHAQGCTDALSATAEGRFALIAEIGSSMSRLKASEGKACPAAQKSPSSGKSGNVAPTHGSVGANPGASAMRAIEERHLACPETDEHPTLLH